MKNRGYGEHERGISFSGEGRQGQALRIMEALSGVDEELLERAGGGELPGHSDAGAWAEHSDVGELLGRSDTRAHLEHSGFGELSGHSDAGACLEHSGVEEVSEHFDDEGIQDISSYKRQRKEGNRGKKRKAAKPLWQYTKPLAAVLCLAVVGALGWGGYQMTLKVNDNASGTSMNNAPMGVEAFKIDSDITAEAGGAEGAELQEADEEAAPQDAGAEEGKMIDHMGQGNAGITDTEGGIDDKRTTDKISDTQGISENGGGSGNQDEAAKEKNEGAASGMEEELDNVKESASVESTLGDSEGCPAANVMNFSEKEARNQEKLGAYLPETLPKGYGFEGASCNLDRSEENLTVTWTRGMDSIRWTIIAEENAPETVDVGKPETYDERLYEIPHAETVPQEYRSSVDNPTFAWEDLDLEIIRSRMMSYTDRGDTDTPRGRFSVLYPDNIVVYFNGRGTAEEIWEMFTSMKAVE